MECIRLSAPPGCDRWKFELLSSQISGKPGKKRHDGGRLNKAASQCVRFECIRLSAPPGCDRWKLELLSSQISGKPGKKRHDGGRLNKAASQCVRYLHVSSDDGVNQA